MKIAHGRPVGKIIIRYSLSSTIKFARLPNCINYEDVPTSREMYPLISISIGFIFFDAKTRKLESVTALLSRYGSQSESPKLLSSLALLIASFHSANKNKQISSSNQPSLLFHLSAVHSGCN